MDNSLTRETTIRGGLTPPAKGKTKPFLIGKELKKLKTKDLRHTAAERRERNDNKTQPKTPDSLRQGASQVAGAAPTLRYGPAGDSAPRLRLKAAGERRAARCLTDSSARSWSSAASVSRATGRGPARFPRPILDARLGDGSRVAICVPPASPHVASTARRFGTRSFSAAQLLTQGALPAHIRNEAERVLHTRRNILVSGGTASGNTTLLNVLIALIPDDPADRRYRGHLGAPHRLPEPRPVRGAPVTAGSRHDPRPRAPRLAAPARSHRPRRSARRRSGRPVASPQHRTRRLARHATTQVSDCRRGAAPADCTRRRWASSRRAGAGGVVIGDVPRAGARSASAPSQHPGVTHGLRHARPTSARPAGTGGQGSPASPGRGMR